jgi:hypothetical protein
MPQCPGCGKSFSQLGGYSNHLLQTQKPACRAVLAQAFEEWWSQSSDSDADTETSNSESDTLVTNHLDLDFEDFNFEGHDDEEDLMYGANDYVEAPVPEQLEGGMVVDEPENDLEEENDLHQAREVRWAAEEAFRKTPVVEAFPSAEAGTPIANTQALPRYDSYKTYLKNPDNPWDPFSSRLDWEVAYWAKRCGPSATAFTKLLKIDGVSTSINANCYTLYLHLYRFASV